MSRGPLARARDFVSSAFFQHDGDLRRFLLRRIGNPEDAGELV